MDGRGSRIRTDDHLSPRQVRYQAALYPEMLFPPRRVFHYTRSDAAGARPAHGVQRRSSTSTSSSSMRTWRTIWLLNADSCLAPSPSRRRRAPPMV